MTVSVSVSVTVTVTVTVSVTVTVTVTMAVTVTVTVTMIRETHGEIFAVTVTVALCHGQIRHTVKKILYINVNKHTKMK